VAVRSGSVRVRVADGEHLLHAGESLHTHPDGTQMLPASRLSWSNRRSIMGLAIANRLDDVTSNPHGWLTDPEIDTRTPAGRAHWRQRMLDGAEAANRCARVADAQGIVVWALEGWQGADLVYPGDPRRLADVAPEMDAIADEFFRRLAAGGLATGVVCKPWPLVRNHLTWNWQTDHPDLASDLVDKIGYARTRWNCSLFFLGWNLTQAGRQVQGRVPSGRTEILPAELLTTVPAKLPGTLVFPEFQLPDTWAAAPGWVLPEQLPLDPRIRFSYPNAFPVIHVGGTDPETLPSEVDRAVADGAVLLFYQELGALDEDRARRVAAFTARCLTQQPRKGEVAP
jgi:hypothetical protein